MRRKRARRGRDHAIAGQTMRGAAHLKTDFMLCWNTVKCLSTIWFAGYSSPLELLSADR